MTLEYYGHFPWEIALIDPDGFAQSKFRKKSGQKLFPHLGLAYMAASLERNGDRVSVLDAGVATFYEIQRFLSQSYQLVGITATSFTFREALAMAREVKRRYPAVPVVLGGPHVAIDPAGCLEDPVIDYAVRGEGEIAGVDLIEVLKRSGRVREENLAQIAGLVFRSQGQVRVNPHAPRIKELDPLPYPAWHLFPMQRYRQHALLSSRGCPMDCGFCAIQSIWGPHWIRRDPEQVASEMAWLLSRWGEKLIHINDDNLTLNRAHIEKLCTEIIRRRLKVNWVAQGMRADAAHPEVLALMRRAGCHRVSLGIESIDPGVLEAIGKKETPEDMARAIRLCHQAGIQVLGMFMIGNPKDTSGSVRASLRFAREQEIDLPAFYLALPYPKTRLWQYVESQGKFFNTDYRSFDHMSQEPVFETPEFSLEERREMWRETENFCRRQALKYHMMFWWPPRLIRRNAYEIGNELMLWLKVLIFPFKIFKFWSRRWSPGGTK